MKTWETAELADLWSEPTPLPNGLPPVPSFGEHLLPVDLRPWVVDIAERMCCPLDFVGIPAMVAAGSLIGRRVTVRPEMHTDWSEAGNLWGCIVGPPGTLKSPAIREALGPMRRLEALAAETYTAEQQRFQIDLTLRKLAKEESEARARKAIKQGEHGSARAALEGSEEPEPPTPVRFMTSDSTAEKLGELCRDNPNGILVHRDELISMFSDLDREEKASARGFFLSAWSGLDGYTFDRIGRGTVRVAAVNVSILGTTQPNRLAGYVRDSLRDRDDGMVQRLQLLAWPDLGPAWEPQDRWPNSAAREGAFGCYNRLAELTPESVGASTDGLLSVLAPPSLRVSPESNEMFVEWRLGLEARIRSEDMAPAFAAHLSKYRGLIPRLALVSHLASGGSGPVSVRAMSAALDWSEYLEAHAARAFASTAIDDASAARAIWRRIKRGDLKSPFTPRDIYRHCWSGLLETDRVEAGLAVLTECGWIRAETLNTGGRPSTIYHVNPRART
jgi:hypothetical protein